MCCNGFKKVKKMLLLMLMNMTLFYDSGVNMSIYMDFMPPTDCVDRIDVVNRSHIFWAGYAWYGGRRILIYDGSMKDDNMRRYVLAHEIGHLCAEKAGRNRWNYAYNEELADEYASAYLSAYDEQMQNRLQKKIEEAAVEQFASAQISFNTTLINNRGLAG
jgi:Zn-dependent peptidase ImmA (M78 family)